VEYRVDDKRIGSLAIPATPVDAATPCGRVFEIFDADPDILVLPVVEDGRPVGLVNRFGFLLRFGDRFGRALFEKQPVTRLMDRAPFVVEASQSVDFVSHLIVTEQEAALLRGFIITRDGRYLGIGTGLSLLRVHIERTQRQALMLREIVASLPIGLTVETGDGRLLIVNETAAGFHGRRPDAMEGRSIYDFMSAETRLKHDLARAALLHRRQAETIEDQREGRTFLTTLKPVLVQDDALLISTSLDITERKVTEEELARRAYYDDLTGLPNRVFVERHVGELLARDERRSFAVAFIDLDNFKQINDFYSHAVGDALLVAVAGRINQQTRRTDLLARISGDEFLLILDPVTTRDALYKVMERVRQALRQPFSIDSLEILTSASIGISLYPDHGQDYETLRRRADNAMYRSKTEAKGSLTLYDDALGEMLTARMALEQRLRGGIRDGQFYCLFQPKVNIREGRITGFEALARWRDGTGQTYGPGHFIGLALELGLLDDITWIVLEEGLKGLGQLDARFGNETTLSINIAAQQASNPVFMAALVDRIAVSGAGRRLMLELTEDGFLAATKFQLQTLPLLKELGVKVSIDDFGTGYSSLATLADITADEIKVDRSFISGIASRPRSQSVLKTIESLCHSLNMPLVAEGVETVEELDYLLSATSISFSQGYFFAEPQSPEILIADASLMPATAPRPKEKTGKQRGMQPLLIGQV